MWDGERESRFGDSDVFISLRQPDGSWGEAVNLGDKVNTEAEEGGHRSHLMENIPSLIE